ncbi:MAG: metallophosphoesterase [Capsulimonadales bacterium]|nr:metallophosphoesterase [Capsulimonadales bacterium]
MKVKYRGVVPPLGIGLAGLGLAYYALRVEPFAVERTHTELFLRRLPPVLDGLPVLFIADLHTADWTLREERIVALVRETPRPELIVWGGDFLRGRHGTVNALRLVRTVADTFPDVPTYGILGNAEHKMMLRERREFGVRLTELGVTMLGNENRPLTLRGETLTLVAVDDPYYGHADLDAALCGARTDRFTLLLSHSPQLATQAARAGVDLMLSGHTHGGQVRLPLIGPLKTQNPLCRRIDMGIFDRARLRATLGYDPGGDLTLYITRGIGLANVPRIAWAAPRFLCPPEVSFLTLRRKV